MPVKSNDSSSARVDALLFIINNLDIILPRVKKYTLVLSPLI